MESFVETTCRLGGLFVFETALMGPILVAPEPGVPTLQAYIAMNAIVKSPYDSLYKDLIVTIIMTKNCGFNSLRKWLVQHKIAPNGQS